jgi:hypothetical protein
MESDHTQEPLEKELNDLETALASERSTARRVTRTGLATVVVICVIALGFVLHNVSTVRSEWTEENMGQSVAKQMKHLQPIVMHELSSLSTTLMPVYEKAARAEFVASSQDLDIELADQLDHFYIDLEANAKSRLKETEKRVIARIEEIINNEFPSLSSPEAKAELVTRFHDVTETAFANTMTRMQAKYSQDIDKLRKTIATLDLPKSPETTAALQKQFVHLWLQIVDEELMKL